MAFDRCLIKDYLLTYLLTPLNICIYKSACELRPLPPIHPMVSPRKELRSPSVRTVEPLREYGQLLVQNRKIFLPHSHLGPLIGVTPMEFLEKRYRS